MPTSLTLQPITWHWCADCNDDRRFSADHANRPLMCEDCGFTLCIDCDTDNPNPAAEDLPVCFDCGSVRMAMQIEQDEWRGSRIWSDEQQPGDDRLHPHGDVRLVVILDGNREHIPDSRRTDRAWIRIWETGWDPDFGWIRPPRQPLSPWTCSRCFERDCICPQNVQLRLRLTQ